MSWLDERIAKDMKSPEFRKAWEAYQPQSNFIDELLDSGVTITEEFWLALDAQFEELAKKGLTLTVIPVNVKHEAVVVEELEYA